MIDEFNQRPCPTRRKSICKRHARAAFVEHFRDITLPARDHGASRPHVFENFQGAEIEFSLNLRMRGDGDVDQSEKSPDFRGRPSTEEDDGACLSERFL